MSKDYFTISLFSFFHVKIQVASNYCIFVHIQKCWLLDQQKKQQQRKQQSIYLQQHQKLFETISNGSKKQYFTIQMYSNIVRVMQAYNTWQSNILKNQQSNNTSWKQQQLQQYYYLNNDSSCIFQNYYQFYGIIIIIFDREDRISNEGHLSINQSNKNLQKCFCVFLGLLLGYVVRIVPFFFYCFLFLFFSCDNIIINGYFCLQNISIKKLCFWRNYKTICRVKRASSIDNWGGGCF
eukprot:TRINITY_DN17398_c0_g3_i1.p1 TRINITY_DN17398_c0_g3~~TRINITY_DN17398_c0_g3_i1.p1  ORF type:complete len:237 (-),score=3.22 TRINITY_DN17398_c0_g3_i1:213-923(-)